MSFRIAVTIATSAALLGACGSSGGTDTTARSHNDAIISAARSSQQSESALHARLKAKLKLHDYAGVPDSYTVPVGLPDVHAGERGNECSIDQILIGKDQVSPYSEDDNTLISPDGSSAVVVGEFMGTDSSTCLMAARDALGW